MNKKGILKSTLFAIALFAMVMVLFSGNVSSSYTEIPVLNSNCPPGFKLNEANKCVSRNLYSQYDIKNKAGEGGLKSALPKIRDGFTPQEIDLGRYLFFDPVLSANQTISCATCHDPNKGFSDGLPVSQGINGHKTVRSATTLWNVGYLKKLFWDGRASTLEEQMQGPLFSKEEMGNTPENLLKSLNAIDTYRDLFAEAFIDRDKDAPIQLNEIFTALTAFQSSLVSLNSKYDQYAHGHHGALNDKEIEGLNVFRSFVARCPECHTPPLFTNQQFAVIGSPEPDGIL